MLLKEIEEIFAEDGTLAKSVPSYMVRTAQLELAKAIWHAIDNSEILIAEAGTGTGKTWAYLTPVFLSGEKALISTGTRNLQDQLYHRDIPNLRKALSLSVNVALLKGRSNYVCHYHLDRLEHDEKALRSRNEIAQLRAIREFTQVSETGDKSELLTVPENADIWQRVTSTRENCLGQECPFIKDCFVYKARRKAQEADVVVVNHALFMADLALREEGITDLLPQVKTIVFDEAHQLPETATRFLGNNVSLHQIMDAAKLAQIAGLAYAREAAKWADLANAIENSCKNLRLTAADILQLPAARATFENIPKADQFDIDLNKVLEDLENLKQALATQAQRHPDIEAAYQTCLSLMARLMQWTLPARSLADGVNKESVDGFGEGDKDSNASKEDGQLTNDDFAVRWVEHSKTTLRFFRVPLSVAKIFSSYRSAEQAWIFTSATLSMRGNFNHFQSQLGLMGANTISLLSPFKYAEQGLLYVPKNLPWPNQAGFLDEFTDALMPLVKICTGGVLILCTTLRAIDLVATRLRANLADDKRLIMCQGESSRNILLERFRSDGHAILVGSTSFWEGIDIPGAALSLVAIDKLPFAPPDDPVLQARLNACKDRGGKPFMEYQLPQAALLLKQGAGRLIRTENDTGVLMVGDGRLVDKPYGRLLWQGLPPFSRTRDGAEAMQFLLKTNL